MFLRKIECSRLRPSAGLSTLRYALFAEKKTVCGEDVIVEYSDKGAYKSIEYTSSRVLRRRMKGSSGAVFFYDPHQIIRRVKNPHHRGYCPALVSSPFFLGCGGFSQTDGLASELEQRRSATKMEDRDEIPISRQIR